MEDNVSTKGFRDIIRKEVETIAADCGWDFSNEKQRGMSFQLWVAKLFCEYDRAIETEPNEGLLLSKDLQIDIVLEDSVRKHLYLIQAKYLGMSKATSQNVERDDVYAFFKKHDLLMKDDYTHKFGSTDIRDFVGDYPLKVQDGYNVDFYYVSNGKASDEVCALSEACNDDYSKTWHNQITCHLMDFQKLKEYYLRTTSADKSVPRKVTLQLRTERFFEIRDVNFPTVVTVIKGNALKDLYQQHREALFAWNIRGYLGDRGINTEIKETAKNRPDDFFYFNNGISAVCTRYEIEGNQLIAYDFQIINGAQTVGAIGRAPSNEKLEILLRITKTLDIKTDKGINSDIIKFNNTQNIIKLSDFRANDPLQKWLEKEFQKIKPRNHMPIISYARKRGGKSIKGVQRLTLEDLAKIRYAFLCEPTLILSSPRDLWTYKSQGGQYETAFGIDDTIPEIWPKDDFEKSLLAIAFYLRIMDTVREEAKLDKGYKYFGRFKWHILALCGVFASYSKEKLDVEKLINSPTEFESSWEKIWQAARNVIVHVYLAGQTEGATLYALVRNAEKWNSMKKTFQHVLRLRLTLS
jgi:hypothetical protein